MVGFNGYIVGRLWLLLAQECLRKVVAALKAGGVLGTVEVDGGAGVLFDTGPFLQADAG